MNKQQIKAVKDIALDLKAAGMLPALMQLEMAFPKILTEEWMEKRKEDQC